MRKQNQQELYSILKETQANEILIINDRKRFKDAEIQADFERLKKDIENSKVSEAEKTNLILKLEAERNGALLQNDILTAQERLKINDKYLEQYLSQIEEANAKAAQIQDFERRRARIKLDEQYAIGLISQKEYFQKLNDLAKVQEIQVLTSELVGLKNELDAINDALDSANVTDKNGLRKFISKEEVEALKKRKEEVQTQMQDLGLKVNETTAKNAVDLANLNEDRIQQAKDYALQAAQAAADGISAIMEAQISEIDNILEVQQSRLENARALAEAGFTGLIQQEQDKLELLQQKREEAVRRQLILDNISRISSQVLAVANAIAGASNPPTPATPFLIAAAAASALATIGASIASARGFATGTDYLKPQNSTQGRKTDDILIRANKGEGIIPTAQNVQYNRVTKGMIDGSPKSIASAVLSYPDIRKHIAASLNYDFGRPQRVQDSVRSKESELKGYIDTIGAKIGDITIVNENTSITMNERGIEKRRRVMQNKLADIRNKV